MCVGGTINRSTSDILTQTRIWLIQETERQPLWPENKSDGERSRKGGEVGEGRLCSLETSLRILDFKE